MGEKVIVSTKIVRKLGELLCTQKEAAAFLGLSYHRFVRLLRDEPEVRSAWDHGSECGKISLRRKQMRLADTSAQMAIFLGKNYLGQRDTIANEVTGRDGKPIEFKGSIKVEFIGVDETTTS